MKNLEIRSLENTSLQEIYDVFIESFSDYEIPMKMSIVEFEEMIITRDIDFNFSAGCFNQGKLVGFIICGYREIEGKKYFYNGGTGMVSEFRRKGIANDLLIYLVDLLKQRNINVFLLEVLENNIPAIDLYRKNGFVIQRRFESFKIEKNKLAECLLPDYTIKSDKAAYINLVDTSFLPSLASWQNDKVSILNNIDNYEYCSVSYGTEVVVFGFIHKHRGDIPQLRVLKGWENKQLELFVINELKDKTSSDVIKFVTLDENNRLAAILADLGFSNFINLYEMTLSFD